MATTLTNFLIGIGFDTKDFDKGSRDIQRGLGDVKSTSLKVSAALIGVFAGVAFSVASTADRIDKLALSTSKFTASANYVSNFGNALRLLGGDAGEALDAVSKIESIMAKKLVGDTGAFKELAMAGISAEKLMSAQTTPEFLSKLAEEMPKLSKQQQLLAQSTLGFSDATMRSLQGGSQEFEKAMQRAEDITGPIDELEADARRLRASMALNALAFEGVTNEINAKFIKSLIGVSEWFNGFVSANRETVTGVINAAASNPAATAALAGGAATTAVGGAAYGAGAATLGAGAMTAGGLAMAAGGSYMAADVAVGALEDRFPWFRELSLSADKAVVDMFGLQPDSLVGKAFGAGSNNSVKQPTPQINMVIEIDGQALDHKITSVSERTNSEAINDIETTTER